MPADRARARLAAEIAIVLTERGLGGDDVDLTHRLEAVPPRSRSRAVPERSDGRWHWTVQARRCSSHSSSSPHEAKRVAGGLG